MFVYTGKFNYLSYASGELSCIILPNGFPRLGDTVYAFHQYTKNYYGTLKANEFPTMTIDKCEQNDDGSVAFHCSHGVHQYAFKAQPAFDSLSIHMSNQHNQGTDQQVKRVYSNNVDASTEPARIWTGKMDWGQYAHSEALLVITPEGWGNDKPILAFWQWTKSATGEPKAYSSINGVQKAEEASGGVVKFTWGSDYYTMTSSWDPKTEKLTVRMANPQNASQDLTPLSLAALHEFHAHDVIPPEPPLESAELKVRYPQAEPALSRIQGPMPFPRTLVETLTHTASFVDQAGYLAKYAVERYSILDKAYHDLSKQRDDLSSQIRDLASKLHELERVGEAQKKEIAELQKKLADALDAAQKREAELQQKIMDLQKTVAGDKDHDAADHKALDEAHSMLKQEQERRAKAEKRVAQLEIALGDSERTVKQLQTKTSELESQLSELQGQLDAEQAENKSLAGQNDELKNKVATLEKNLAAVQKNLARTTEDLKEAQADLDDKDKIIEGLEKGLAAAIKDRDSKKKAYTQLKEKTDVTIEELQDEITSLKAGGAGGSGGGVDTGSLFPTGCDDSPGPLKQSIAKHNAKASWAHMSDWVGCMANRGTFFNCLDDVAGPGERLAQIDVYANTDWITGLSVRWRSGKSKSYGVTRGSPASQVTCSEADDAIVNATAIADDRTGQASYKPVSVVSMFKTSRGAGPSQESVCMSAHSFDKWMKPVVRHSLAPALDGSWALLGPYGYFDGSLDALGWVWARTSS